MGRHNRLCLKGTLNHCYNKTIDGFLIFYSVSDYLVFFTLLCVLAPRYKVTIVAVALMPDHFHLSLIAPSWIDLWRFMQQLQSMFVKEHNFTCHRKGSLLHSPFGSAPKTTDKVVRTNIAYVANNPVERHLSQNAEEYRWTFLKYAVSNHPFSKPISRSRSSREMKKALGLVDSTYAMDKHLTYPVLQKMHNNLNDDEWLQLIDYIIVKYSVIDYQVAISYYGSYGKMISAIHYNTGSEYDLKETFTGKRDDVYANMSTLLMQTGRFKDIHDVLGLNADEKIKMFNYLNGKTEATPRQIANFLHIKMSSDPKMRNRN